MIKLKITCGNPNDHDGRTTFNLYEEGTISIYNETMGMNRKFKDHTDSISWNKLLESIIPHAGINTLTNRKGTAHEAIYEIQFGDSKSGEKEITIWQNDLKKYPALKALVDAARQCVTRFSNGEVRL